MKRTYYTLLHIIFLAIVSIQTQAQTENRLYLSDLSGMESTTISLPVYLDNTSTDISGIQFDITLPKDTLSVITGATTLSDRCVDHEPVVYPIGNGVYRVMLYSPNNTPLNANSGEVLTLSVKVANVLDKNKVYPLKLSRVSVGNTQGDNMVTATTDGTFRCLACPDFAVSNIQCSSTTVAPGDTIEVGWKVSNVGGAPSKGGWSERIIMVDTSGAEVYLGTCYNSDAILAKGASASRSARVAIPPLPGLEGDADIRIELVPNADSGEGEAYRANNSLQSTTHRIQLTKFLLLTLPMTTVVEGEKTTLRCKLSRSGHTASTQTFTLTMPTGDSRLTLPQSVDILQGQSTAWFTIALINNDILDNDSLFVIKASGNGYDAVQQTLSMTDDELRHLTLTVSKSTLNEGQTFTLTVKTEKAMTHPITVTLTAEHPERLLLPETVTIDSRATKAQVTVTVVDNESIELPTDIAIKGTADKHHPGECLIMVNDNDMPAIDLELSPSTVSENGGRTAVIATLRRTTHTDREATILLSKSSDDIFLSTDNLTLAAGDTERQFTIGVRDNDQVDGTRHTSVTAAVRVASCDCSADTTTVGSVKKTLEITDDDGASIRLTTSRASIVKGSGETATLTITRNTNTINSLTVTLNSNNDVAVAYPHSITIPAKAASIEVTVTATEGASTDAKTVAFNATASNHAKGSCWIALAETPYPIAIVKDVTLSSTEATSGGNVEVTLTIANVGTADLPENTKIELYVDGKKQLYSLATNQVLAPGEELTMTETLLLPETVGEHEITFKVEDSEGTGGSTTWTVGNSPSVPVTLNTTSPYTATVTPDKTTYHQEDVVTFSGQLHGEKTARTNVQITLYNEDARQLLTATTDAEGHFTTTYQLRSLQTGHFTVNAGYPGENVTEEMASFDVYGLTAEAPEKLELVLPETYTGSIRISNPGNKVQTNVQVEMLSESSTCDFSFSTLNSIPAGASVELPFTVTTKELSDGNEWQKMSIVITSDEGAIVRRSIRYYVQCKTGKLKSSTSYIDATMNIYTAKDYPIVVKNIGKGETGKITLSLPSWVTTATPKEMASLDPGDSATVLLKFNPTSDMQLNVAVTGNIGFQCSNGEGTTIPFRLTPVSELKGRLTLDVVDELTYYTEEAPHVNNATVKLIHPSTKQVIASGTTDVNGLFTTEIEEGWYNVRVEAENHDPYTNNLVINPGRERKELIQLEYNAISSSLDVEEIELEDEYKVDVTVVSETSAPVPIVDIWWDKQWHELGDIFPVVVTNRGYFTAYDIEVTMAPQPGTKFIFLDDPRCDELKGQTAVEYLVKVVEDEEGNEVNHAPRKAGTENQTTGPTPSSGCEKWGAGVTYYVVCCKKKVPHYSISYRHMGKCDSPNSSGSSGSGGSSSGIVNSGASIYHLQSIKEVCDEEEPNEEAECDEEPNLLFQLLSVKFKDPLRGIAADGKTQVRIALAKEATKPKKECNYTYQWELSTSGTEITNDPTLKMIKTKNANTLDQFIITAPEDYPWPDEKAKEHDIYAILKYRKEGGEWLKISVKVTISRVPVVFVHGLNSNPTRCWSGMIDYLNGSNCYDGSLLYTVDYEKTNRSSFSTNQLIVFNTVIDVLNNLSMNHDIETAKVDIVGHSMGGLLTRQDISKGLKDYIHKFITINTPHGGSQLGNFLTDPKIINLYKDNFLHHLPWLINKGVFNALYWEFSPTGLSGPCYETILQGAVNDLSVGGPAIGSINKKQSGYKCHAITTASHGETDSYLETFGFNRISHFFGFNNRNQLFTELFGGINDCIVAYISQKGGLDGDYISEWKQHNGSFAHTSSCNNPDVKQDVLNLLKEKSTSAKFADGFNSVTGLQYDTDNKYTSQIANWFDQHPNLLPIQSQRIKAKVLKAPNSFGLTYNYTFGDTLMNVSVTHNLEIKDIFVSCLYNDSYISFLEGDNGSISLPQKILGNVVLLYEGLYDDGTTVYAADTISVNTIGSATISQLSFTTDSLLIINNEYVSPHVKCIWSDGVVTDLEDAILSVVDEDMAYVDNNRWVYGRKAGRTELRATYQSHSCSIPLNVVVCKRDRNVDEDDDHSNANEVCNVITLQISQEAVMTRQAFRATFTLNNGHQTSSLKDFKLNIEIHDQDGNLVTPHEFQVNLDSLVNFQGEKQLNNAWMLQPKESGKAIMTLIPTKYAAPTLPTTYSIGGSFSYTDPYSGLLVTREIAPVDILVNPSPDLDLTYFIQRDIFGDDPLTANVVEPMKLAEFALLINNKGNGNAKNVRFATAQPEIVENEKGLVIDYSIKSSQLNGQDATLALGETVVTDFGNIDAHSKTYAQWWLESTLLGHFIDYDVQATHVSSYGNDDLSLLGDVTIHELIHGFTTNAQTETPVRAFLTNDIPDNSDTPDMLYFTDDREEEMVSLASEVIMNRISDTEYEVTVTPSVNGWTYGKVNDLTAGKQQIVSIVRRSDGMELPIDNFWQTDRTLRDGKKPRYENMLHLAVETNREETYLLTFTSRPTVELAVQSIAGPPAEGDVLLSQLTSVVVTFNKAIDANTFNADDLSLNWQGKLVDLSTLSIVQNSETEYLIQFGEATFEGGFYVFTVQTENITDVEGYTGFEGKMATWTQYPDGKVTLKVKASPEEGGSVTPATGRVGRDAEVTLMATPAEGYMFYRWLHYDNPLEETESFNYTLTHDEEFTAEFIPIIFEDPENDTDRETYAVLSPDSTTLTFYYDGKKAKRQGIVYGMNKAHKLPEWYRAAKSIQHVVFNFSFAAARPVSTYAWFFNMESITEIEGLQYLNTSEVNDMGGMFEHCKSLPSLDLSHFDTSNVTNMNAMFYDCTSLITLDASHFETSKVTDMRQMFEYCRSLTSLDLSHFDTSNVKYMSSMFKNCENLTSLDVSHFNTSNVTNMISMFRDCYCLTSLDVGHFDTSNVTDFGFMFYSCNSLTSLDVSHFNTSNATNMRCMFSSCRQLTSLDVEHFDTSNVTDMSYMFCACRQLTSLDVSHFNTSNVTNLSYMFQYCESLTSLDVSHFETSNVTNMGLMFYYCKNLTSLDVSHFNTSKVVGGSNYNGMDKMFQICQNLEALNLGNFTFNDGVNTRDLLGSCSKLKYLIIPSTSSSIDENSCSYVGTASAPCSIIAPDGFDFGVDTSASYFRWKGGYFKLMEGEPYAILSPDSTTLTFYYDDLKTTRQGNVYGMNTGNSLPEWHNAASSVQQVIFDFSFSFARPVSTNRWFYEMSYITKIEGLQYLNTSKVTNMNLMFCLCENLLSIDVSHFDTSNVNSMLSMFYGCKSLTALDVSHFNTSNVTNMTMLFYMCQNLTTLDVSHFNTSKVTSMGSMFRRCNHLTAVDVSHFDTSNVTDMNHLFYECYNLTTIDVSNFRTSNVTTMAGMFGHCRQLTTLDVSHFNTSKVTRMGTMFDNCSSLTNLNLNHFDLSNVTDNQSMLRGCSSLKELSVSSSMENIDETCCNLVGTATNPCTIIAPVGFDFGVDTYSDYFYWKGGYFKLGSNFLPGDVNHDGTVNITDVIMVVNDIMGMTPNIYFSEEADVNGDQTINVTDVIVIVNFILNSEVAIVPANARLQMSDIITLADSPEGYVINLENHETYSGIQMDVTLPENTYLKTAWMENNRSNAHKVIFAKTTGNRYRIVIYSLDGNELKGNEGALLHMNVVGDRHKQVSIGSIMMTNKFHETVVLPDVDVATSIDTPKSNDDTAPSFTIQGVKASKYSRGIILRKGRKHIRK